MNRNIEELSMGTFDEALKTEKLTVVEFYTTTCPNCAAVAPIYEAISNELKENAVFAKVNARENMDLALRYGIMGTPTFKFFCRGIPIGEIVGEVNATLLRNTIKDLIRHRNECASKSTRLVYEIDGYG